MRGLSSSHMMPTHKTGDVSNCSAARGAPSARACIRSDNILTKTSKEELVECLDIIPPQPTASTCLERVPRTVHHHHNTTAPPQAKISQNTSPRPRIPPEPPGRSFSRPPQTKPEKINERDSFTTGKTLCAIKCTSYSVLTVAQPTILSPESWKGEAGHVQSRELRRKNLRGTSTKKKESRDQYMCLINARRDQRRMRSGILPPSSPTPTPTRVARKTAQSLLGILSYSRSLSFAPRRVALPPGSIGCSG